ncbi:MAG TPA: NAD(P)-dependent oxidoreductase [Chloroflexota bacterium]|nr:NAD(P)-dependent oxidoreductase [Chloroflexota bacterium]
MPEWFDVTHPPLAPVTPRRRSVLVTGAAGRIGSYFTEHTAQKYTLRLMVQDQDEAAERLREFGEVAVADLGQPDRLRDLCDGIDTVLHLAADPDPSATWNSLLPNNIIGTYNIMRAARAAGCRRLIFASSIHAVSGYPADVQVKVSDPVNPGDLYGVSKCFGEALGRYLAEQEGLSVICIRIGWFLPVNAARGPDAVSMLDAFVSRRDLLQLIERAIDVENIRFAIVNGLSNNRFKRLDISDARALLGYDPRDDVTALNAELADLHLWGAVNAYNLTDREQRSGLRDDE